MEELQWAPRMRAATGKRGKFVATGEEVGGEACTRAGKRVMEAKDGSRLEALFDGPSGGPQGSGGLTFGPSRALLVLVHPCDIWAGQPRPAYAFGFGKSKTNCALLEEDARYENVPISIGLVVSDSPFSPSPIYGRTNWGSITTFLGLAWT
ncbi:hypothetical protein AAG906_018413 [Vitis piasezkii]